VTEKAAARFDKFAFLRAIEDDHTITDYGAKYVLHAIGNRWMQHNGSTLLTVRQHTIADALGVNISAVKRAYSAARERGYFVLAKRRKPGPAPDGERPDADAYRLCIPGQESWA
jgi:hypothetical protein